MAARLVTGTAIAGLLALAGTVAVVLLDSPDPDSSVAPSILGAPDGSVLAAGLVQPTDCADLASTMEALAEEYGWQGGHQPYAIADLASGARAAEESAAGADGDAAVAPQDTGGEAAGGDATNVQEAGVDEPDIVERVGDDLVVVGTEGTIRVLDVSSGEPVARGVLAVQEWAGDLGVFAVGEDRVAVLAQGEGVVVREDPADSMIRPGGWGTTIVTLVDLADPDAPREVSRMELEGSLVDARAVDGVLRLAVRSEGPQIDLSAQGEFDAEQGIDWGTATEEDLRRYEAEYQAEYEQRMAEARAQLQPEHWQPHATVDGRTIPLVGCDRIGFPTSYAGMGTLTLAAVDATGDSLAIDDAEAVVTSGENLYATTDRVVIATTRFEPCCPGVPEPLPVDPEPVEPTFVPEEPAPAVPTATEEPAPPPVEPTTVPTDQPTTPATEVPTEVPTEAPTEEAVATASVEAMIDPAIGMIAPWGPGGATDLHVFDVEGTLVSHVASGSVDGSLVNQYAMSIHEGVLRTATTAWVDDRTESLVTTFRVEGTDLVRLGQVGDLGPDEDIQAVRFMGTTAYVVTFRRTDPLYVVDLSDPSAPRTRGELKIEGYSAYLHPLGDGRLLGVGQDADPATGMTRGVQVSTFDVTDRTAPRRIDVDVTPDSNSEVEWEPHALTITADGHALVPVEIWGGEGRSLGGFGAVVYRLGNDGALERVGLLDTGSDWQLRPRRTLDVGGSLLTVGDRGVVAWDGSTFEPTATLRFAAPTGEGQDQSGGDTSSGPGFDPAG